MGLLSSRKRKIASNAAEYLEPGEEVREIVMTQTGATAMESGLAGGAIASGEGVAAVPGHVHALVATDRHVYALSVPTWTGIDRVVIKQPLQQTDLRLDGKEIHLGGLVFNVLFFAGGDARRLVEFARR